MSENGRSDGYLRGSVRFEDVDHYASSIAPVWELEIQQVSRAEGGGGCQFVTDGAALAYHEHYPATVALRGALSGGLIGFAITDRQGRRGRWQGGEHPDHGLAHADAAREIDVVMPGGTRNLVVVLRASAFREVFESLADRTVAEVFGKDRMFQQLAPGERERLRAAWWNLMARPPGEVSFGFALVEVLVAAMEQGRPVEPTDWPRVRCLFRRALEQMEGSGESIASPGVLAERLGVSLRSLQIAFKACIGITPSRYLRYRRLNRVRGILAQRGPGDISVHAAALSHGFVQLGRFAGEYRRLFGESPSETLRRPDPGRVERLPRVG